MNKMLFKKLKIKRIIGPFYNLNLMIEIRKKLDKIIFKMIMLKIGISKFKTMMIFKIKNKKIGKL